MKRVVVISLGGSIVVPSLSAPERVVRNIEFLHKFKETLRKHYSTHKFVIVVGGGAIARLYIEALRHERKGKRELAMAGIRATRMNALFLMQFFGKEANEKLPRNMKEVKTNLPKNNVVICGALRFAKNATSDSTAAKLAHYFKTIFINITNVDGLYTSDPRKNPRAKLVRRISWEKFHSLTSKIKFKAGQNFVLDQLSAELIKEHKIDTYIIGPNVKSLAGILEGKPFVGTLISS
ncbi:UMP kinase [Candidatus Pacearchaeota archaeon]|nr:MAG: UMP kinase [Candidatus Pacearchaeota archaeon]